MSGCLSLCFQEVVKSLDRFDEGLLQTLNSWILKVQDDPLNRDMVRKSGHVNKEALHMDEECWR
jgi:hypothetical protein